MICYGIRPGDLKKRKVNNVSIYLPPLSFMSQVTPQGINSHTSRECCLGPLGSHWASPSLLGCSQIRPGAGGELGRFPSSPASSPARRGRDRIHGGRGACGSLSARLPALRPLTPQEAQEVAAEDQRDKKTSSSTCILD